MHSGLWSFMSFGTSRESAVTAAAGYSSTPEEFRREVAERRQRDANTAPNMITTPEKFRALIAAQRAERDAAAQQSAAAAGRSGGVASTARERGAPIGSYDRDG
jgi:hypothetical protein